MEAIAQARESIHLNCPSSPPYRDRRLGALLLVYLVGVFFLAGGPDFSISLDDAFYRSVNALRSSVSSGDPIRQIIFISFGLLGIVGYAVKARAQFRPSGWVPKCAAAFGLWIFLSLTWSDDPALTLRRLTVITMMVLGTVWISRRYSVDEIPRFVVFSTSTYLAIGIVTEFILGTFKPFLARYRFSGTMHPNEQGVNCAILLLSITAIAESTRRWSSLRLAGACVALAFLLLTKSRTSIAGAIVALVVFWYFKSRKSRRAVTAVFLISICATLALSAFASPAEQVDSIILMGREQSNAGILTGRNLIWNDVLPYYLEHPFVGYGYETFWSPARIEAMADRLGPGGAPLGHSTYFDLLLDLGPVGLVLGCGCLGLAFYQSISRLREGPTSGKMLCIMIFTFFAIHELAESSLMYPGLSQFVFLWCLLAVGWRRVPRKPPSLVAIGYSPCAS